MPLWEPAMGNGTWQVGVPGGMSVGRDSGFSSRRPKSAVSDAHSGVVLPAVWGVGKSHRLETDLELTGFVSTAGVTSMEAAA